MLTDIRALADHFLIALWNINMVNDGGYPMTFLIADTSWTGENPSLVLIIDET